MSSVKVHLVDGTYELFRAFYGPAPGKRGPDGREVGAIRGIMRTLLALVTRDRATHVGVAFDHVIESFRNNLYAGYKTGAGIDPDLRGQFEDAEEAVCALGMVVWPMVEFEADDAIAAAAAKFAPHVDQVIICSPDKDMMQCVVGNRVICWDRSREKVYDHDAVVAKFGVPPAAIADYLALVGDAADGFPGVARWGAKSTAKVLSAHGSLEAIPTDVGDWAVKVRGAAGLSSTLNAARADAELFKVLATLRLDTPIPESLEAMRWKGADRARLEPLCRRIGDLAMLDRVPLWL